MQRRVNDTLTVATSDKWQVTEDGGFVVVGNEKRNQKKSVRCVEDSVVRCFPLTGTTLEAAAVVTSVRFLHQCQLRFSPMIACQID